MFLVAHKLEIRKRKSFWIKIKHGQVIIEKKLFSTWIQEKSCLKIKCKRQNQRVHCTHCIFSQRVKQCVNSISLGYRTFCFAGYTLSLKTLPDFVGWSDPTRSDRARYRIHRHGITRPNPLVQAQISFNKRNVCHLSDKIWLIIYFFPMMMMIHNLLTYKFLFYFFWNNKLNLFFIVQNGYTTN
jgi:hypothetical protein